MLAYKIHGLEPGFAEGLLFYSCVPDLQSQPDLWLDECPYLHARMPSHLLQPLHVELVKPADDAFQRTLPAPLLHQQPHTQSAAA